MRNITLLSNLSILSLTQSVYAYSTHPFITAPSKSTPSKFPSKKVANIDSPSSPSSPGKQKRLPQANELKINPQANFTLITKKSQFLVRPQANPEQTPSKGGSKFSDQTWSVAWGCDEGVFRRLQI